MTNQITITQETITNLINAGASRWTKGDNDRLYLNKAGYELAGVFTKYNKYQKNDAMALVKKIYIDLDDMTLVLPKNPQYISGEHKAIASDILAALNGEETQEETVTTPATETVETQPTRTKIRSWMEECNDPREIDCSMDIVTEWLMADGTKVTERTHAY